LDPTEEGDLEHFRARRGGADGAIAAGWVYLRRRGGALTDAQREEIGKGLNWLWGAYPYEVDAQWVKSWVRAAIMRALEKPDAPPKDKQAKRAWRPRLTKTEILQRVALGTLSAADAPDELARAKPEPERVYYHDRATVRRDWQEGSLDQGTAAWLLWQMRPARG